MFKILFFIFVAAVAIVSGTPLTTPAITESTEFSGNFEDAIIGTLKLTSPASSSLERRQFGSYDGDVILCSDLNCASNCWSISTSGGGAYGTCLFTLPNPFFSFALTNPPVGYYYPFTIGINIAPASCPNNLFQLTRANTCYNINTSTGGNGWTLQAGDISIINN
ncbi:hypothetical protein D9619_010996 [Psilocybe cf. subviscida]|uniref:Uncharacterized protein n=1 Tax=Psilocybe cf. subviscida TaxID=2480587 RepID=A0A8H5EZQ9_9AGAR|nr:hypothetical protein D9619_010996 [Psilocybe cf. subviscida]